MRPRRLLLASVAVIAVTALAFAAVAAAKQTSVTVSAPRATPHVNMPWTLTVHVALRGKPYPRAAYRPTLYVVNGTGIPIATFHGTRIAPGTFRVALIFPRAGAWRYVIPDPVNGEWSFVAPRVRA